MIRSTQSTANLNYEAHLYRRKSININIHGSLVYDPFNESKYNQISAFSF